MFGISDFYLKALQEILENYKAVVFGSRARGDFGKTSDIDICIFDIIDTKSYLDLLIKIDELEMPVQVDLVIFKNLDDPVLKENISKEGVKI